MSAITVERHSHDGFTLYGTDREGCLVHIRYMGYTLSEARQDFRAYLGEI